MWSARLELEGNKYSPWSRNSTKYCCPASRQRRWNHYVRNLWENYRGKLRLLSNFTYIYPWSFLFIILLRINLCFLFKNLKHFNVNKASIHVSQVWLLRLIVLRLLVYLFILLTLVIPLKSVLFLNQLYQFTKHKSCFI